MNCRCPPNCNNRASRVSRQRRSRADPTIYQPCSAGPGDGKNFIYDNENACKSATACIGSGKAYSYMCGSTDGSPAVLKEGGTGQNTPALTNCYDCADGACGFIPNGTGTSAYNTKANCNVDPTAKCGWKWGCTA